MKKSVKNKILVTGSAGFIGFHLVKKLIGRGDEVLGLDCINKYYDVNLKYARLKETGIDKENILPNKKIKSSKYKNYSFIKTQLEEFTIIKYVLKSFKPDVVCNLAAQAGVRYSIENPFKR